MELLIALHVDITKTAKGHGLGDALQQRIDSSRMAERLQPHSQENHWKGLWPSAGCRGAFYYSSLVVELIVGLRNWSHTLRYALSLSVENSKIVFIIFFRWL